MGRQVTPEWIKKVADPYIVDDDDEFDRFLAEYYHCRDGSPRWMMKLVIKVLRLTIRTPKECTGSVR